MSYVRFFSLKLITSVMANACNVLVASCRLIARLVKRYITKIGFSTMNSVLHEILINLKYVINVKI